MEKKKQKQNQERHLKELSFTHKSAITLTGHHEWSEFERSLGLRSVLVNQCGVPPGEGSYKCDKEFRQMVGRKNSSEKPSREEILYM